ncbi:MAG: SPOR domain-containing protein [Mariprofundaceae bacterium]
MPQDNKSNDFEPTIQINPHSETQPQHEPRPDPTITPKSAQRSPKQPESTPSNKKTSNKLTLIITCIALFAALAAAWVSLSTQDKVQQIEQQSSLQLPQTLAELALLQQQLDHLSQQLNQLQKQQAQTPLQQRPISKVPTTIVKPFIRPHPVRKSPPLVQSKAQSKKVVSQSDPAINPKGNWQVVIASYQDVSKARKQQQQLKSISTLIQPVIIASNTWYRLVKTGFNNKRQAKEFALKLKQQGIKDAWVTQKRSSSKLTKN